MLNKKLLSVVSVAAVLSSSAVFAKTQGNYVGVDFLATTYKLPDTTSGISQKEDETSAGVGFNYKYAFNFNGFFVAPGIFYNANNARYDQPTWSEKLDNSYGIKADLGYDLTDKFSPFVTFGYQENRIEYIDSNPANSFADTRESLIYGIGAQYSVIEDINISLAYEYVDYNKSKQNVTKKRYNPDVYKLGISYNF